MDAYTLLRRVLFSMPAEFSHDFSLKSLALAERLKLINAVGGDRKLQFAGQGDESVTLFGLRFPNRVGLAAGLDKNGDYFPALAQFGFGFLEIGTVTPEAQSGNAKPRMYRLEAHEAIINRMGFNNKGVGYLSNQVKAYPFHAPKYHRHPFILGINVGKNKLTSEADALKDYELAMEQVFELAHYITVNISSPNTPGLRNLQFGDSLKTLLRGVDLKRRELAEKFGTNKPILVKVAPDMEFDELDRVLDILLEFNMDGVIATNTTVERDSVADSRYGKELGGLSGAPLTQKSYAVCEHLANRIAQQKLVFPLISVGGIMSADEAARRISCGADLVQLYSGFIYKGPALVTQSRLAILQANNKRAA